MLEILKTLVVDRSLAHWGRYDRRGMHTIFMNALPDVRVARDWNTSATKRWSQFDLDQLHTQSARRLAKWLVPDRRRGHADLEAEAVIELVMHNESEKAHDFMTEVMRRRPQARESFTLKLGHQITQLLLTDPSAR